MKSKINIDALAVQAFKKAATEKTSMQSLMNLLTEKEQITIGRRILIAQAIMAGKTRYEVDEHLRVSPNTFAQVRRWLDTELSGYTSAHTDKTDARTDRTHTSKYVQPLSYAYLKRSYPAHFLLFNLAEEIWKLKEK